MTRWVLACLALAALPSCGDPSTDPATAVAPTSATDLMLAAALPPSQDPEPRAETVDSLLEAALTLAREDHPGLDADAVRAEIAALARTYRSLLGEQPTPRERARALARLLFDRFDADHAPFSAVADLDSLETLHIDSVLARRAGYCLSLSVVALAVADEAGEPLHGVAMPNHFFVRWDDGSSRFNLELTRGGEQIDDEALAARLGAAWHADSIYLRNLDDAQTFGVLLHNRAYANLAQGRPAAARRDLARAQALVPELPELHRTLGILCGEQQRWEQAIAAFERALALYPGDVDALLNLALSRQASGDLAGAIEDAELVQLLDPSRQRPAELLAVWRAQSRAHALPAGARALDDPPPGLAPGLLGTYYAGTRFERAVATRADRDLDFDWKRDSPIRGAPSDRFSVRWTGWFKATESGLYTLFVVANDGVRIRFGDELAVDHWEDAGYSSWTGSGDASLVAGWHQLQIDYYDRSDNARLFCIIGREGQEYPLELDQHLFHERR